MHYLLPFLSLAHTPPLFYFLKHQVATPAHWQSGEACMLFPSMSSKEARVQFKDVEKIDLPSGKSYLRLTPQPSFWESWPWHIRRHQFIRIVSCRKIIALNQWGQKCRSEHFNLGVLVVCYLVRNANLRLNLFYVCFHLSLLSKLFMWSQSFCKY